MGIKLLCSCIEADHSVNFLFPVSYSMIRVPCAGRVLVDKTQPQTRRGYREWTSPPLPPPLPPQAHLAMKMLPVTPRFSLFHKRKHETVLRPSSASLQLKPGHFSVSGERDSETRWTQILGFFLFCFFSPSFCAEGILGPAPAATVTECLRRWDSMANMMTIIITVHLWVGFLQDPEQNWSQIGLLFDENMSLRQCLDTFYI